MDGSWTLGVALGHVRNAVVAFVAADDPSGESVFLAAECLGLDASESLDAATAALAAVRPGVPLAVWAALQAVRTRAIR